MRPTCAAACLAAACAVARPTRPPAPPPEPSPPPDLPTTLGMDDVFEVRVYGEEDLSSVYQVETAGEIRFPLIGTVRVLDRTPSEVAAEIADRLRATYLRDPHVSVFVKEFRSRKVNVLGEVKTPGTYPYVDRMTVVEAISMAGGFTPLAHKNGTLVNRQGQRIPVRVEDITEGRAPAFFVRPGDTITVPERIF